MPSLFADDSAATSVAPNEDDQVAMTSNTTHDLFVEEIIIPQHTSLLYDSHGGPDRSPSGQSFPDTEDTADRNLVTDEYSSNVTANQEYAVDFDYGRVSYEDVFPHLNLSVNLSTSQEPSQLNRRSCENFVDEGCD